MLIRTQRAETKSLGFTLIELLTAVAIIGILSAFVLTKTNTSKQNLNRAAQQLALDIRKAQNLALAPDANPAPCLYGINIPNANNPNNDKYLFYKNYSCAGVGGHKYNPGNSVIMGNPIYLGASHKGVTFTALNKDTAFEAPEPIAYSDGSTGATSISLTCGAACGTKTITVNRFGMVEIQ